MLRATEILIILLLLIPTVWALIDLLRAPADRWEASKQNQVVWLLVVLLITPLLGGLFYLFVARPRLQAPSTESAG